MIRKSIILAALISVAGGSLYAQQKTVWFTGLGRAEVENNNLTDTVQNITGKEADGYTLFDLGVHAQSGKNLRANVVLRLQNEFGGFFGDGSFFQFRQMKLEGIVGNKVKYEIGDIDLGLTPYTLHNASPYYSDYESGLFALKRDIIDYENFYTDDNTWRLQGANTSTALLFNKGIKKLGFQFFGTRIVPMNGFVPDRFLYGGKVSIVQSDNLALNINNLSISDLPGSVGQQGIMYSNSVYTGDLSYKRESENFIFGLKSELGLNNSKGFSLADSILGVPDTSVSKADGFYDFELSAKYKPLGIDFAVGYRSVSPDFVSPGAQTRRIMDYSNSAVFPVTNDSVSRRAMVFDRFTQVGGLYNRGINTTLMSYAPFYNNVTPYGKATPNRQGFSVNTKIKHKDDFYVVSVEVDRLTEIAPVYSIDVRNFTAIRGGGKAMINKIAGLGEKEISVQAGYSSESTSRNQGGINLNSSTIDAGVDVEAFKKFHLLFGYKGFSAKGIETALLYDQYNSVDQASTQDYKNYDISESVTSVGFRYDFSKKAFFVLQAQMVSMDEKISHNITDSLTQYETTGKYDLNQLYFLYSLSF